MLVGNTSLWTPGLLEEKARLEQSIIEIKIQNPALNREQIAFFLDQFKHTDTKNEDQRQRLIDSFVNAVYVFDDKIVLIFNYKNGTKTIDLDTVKSSDLAGCCPPTKPSVFVMNTDGFLHFRLLLIKISCKFRCHRFPRPGKYPFSWQSQYYPR